MKTCTNCKEEKDTSLFYKQKASKDGLHPYCKSCSSERNKKNYFLNHKKYREKNNAYNRLMYAANPNIKNAKNKEWAKNNKDKIAVIQKRYRDNHPEAKINKANRRRALKQKNGVFAVSQKEIRRLRRMPCIYCGAKSEHIDHVIPLTRGGRHSIGNLVAACARCNISKNNKFIVEWKAS